MSSTERQQLERQLAAHLRCADSNPVKRSQHIVSAAYYADQLGVQIPTKYSRATAPEIEFAAIFRKIDKERQRRLLTYGDILSSDQLWLVDVFHLFRLTHSKLPRRCLLCEGRVEPQVLHFASNGSYTCQPCAWETANT